MIELPPLSATDARISSLDAATSLATNDLFLVVDVSDVSMAPTGTDKKSTVQTVFNTSAVPILNPAANFAALDARDKTNLVSGAICYLTNGDLYQFVGGAWVEHSSDSNVALPDCIIDGVGGAVDTFASFNAAVLAVKKSPKVTANVSETVAATLINDMTVYTEEGFTLAFGNFEPKSNGHSITFNMLSANSAVTWTPLSSKPFWDGASASEQIILTGPGTFLNNGAVANTPLTAGNYQTVNCGFYKAGDAENAGLIFTALNSSMSKCLVYTTSPACNLPVVNNGGLISSSILRPTSFAPRDFSTFTASSVSNELTFPDGTELVYTTGTPFTVSTTATLPEPLVTGTKYYAIYVNNTVLKLATTFANAKAGAAITLTTDGSGDMTATTATVFYSSENDLSQLIQTQFSGTVESIPVVIGGLAQNVITREVYLTIETGCANTVIDNVQTNDGTINILHNDCSLATSLDSSGITVLAGTTGTSIENSNTGTYAPNGCPVRRALNYPVIGNSAGDSDEGIELFQAGIDATGATNHYSTVVAAYAAGKKIDLVLANTVETSDLVLSATSEVAVTINQGLSWDIAATQIDGTAGGTAFTLSWVDQSAVFKYAMTGTNLPFAAFDINSTISLLANGGTVQNTSAVDNTYITGNGDLFVNGAYFLLANQYHSGIKTNPYAEIKGVWFQGAGVACEVAIETAGGVINGTVITGQYKTDGVLILATAPSFVRDTTIDINGAAQLEAQGLFDGLIYTDTSSLVLTAQSDTVIANIPKPSEGILSLAIPSGVENVDVLAVTLTGVLSLAVDNTAENITFLRVTFQQDTIVYGSNINFIGCKFYGNLTTDEDATGEFIGCEIIGGGTFTDDGDFRLSGNDSAIGNDYAPAIEFISTTTQQMSSKGKSYVAENAALTTFTLPATFQKGEIFKIIGNNVGGWKLAQNAGQQISVCDTITTTIGASGYVQSTAAGDCIELLAVTDNTALRVVGSMGNPNYL